MALLLGLLGMAAANGAAVLAAHALWRRARTGTPHRDLVLFLLLRIAVVSLAVLAAGAAGALSGAALGTMGAAALAVLLLLGEHRRLPSFQRPDVPRWMVIIAILLLLRLALQVWFFAPHQPDTLSYHLPKIGEWIQHGGFTREWGLDRRSTFPAGFELVETWWAVFLRHDVLIEMAGIEFLLLGAASAYALGRETGLAHRGALLGALLFSTTPALLLQAVTCLNDGPAASLFVATAALILARVHPALLLLPVGLGLGVKPTYGYALPGLALLYLLSRREASPVPCAGRWAAAIGTIGGVLGSVWYFRNLALYGNPIHPVGLEGIAAEVGGKTLQRLGPNLDALTHNVRRLVDERIFDHARAYGAQCELISGWGAAAFAVGLVGLLVGLREDRRLRLVALSFGASLACVLALVVSDPWFLRFSLFFPALLAIAAARLAEACPRLEIALSAAVLFQFVGTMVPDELPVGGLRTLAGHGWRTRAMDVIPDVKTPGEAVGCLGGDTIRAYPLYRPDFSRRVVYLRPATADELLAALERQGLRVLFANRTDGPVAEAVRRGRLRRTVGFFFEVP